MTSERRDLLRWTRSCPRTGGALYARPKVAPNEDAHKNQRIRRAR
jgi:hypothetical protein